MKKKLLEIHYHIMLLPGMILLLLFSIVPCFGIIMAFQNYNPGKGFLKSDFVGLEHFRDMMIIPNSGQIFFNTIFIAVMKIAGNIIIPLVFALLLNELRFRFLKRSIQTIVYLPNFISWVILAAIFLEIFSYSGIVNSLMKFMGMEPVLFLASNQWFPAILISTDIWKSYGFNAIVYLAAITSINPTLYEASKMDGASRLQQVWHITLPGLASTIVLLATLALGNIMNANFDQVFNMYNPLVYQSSDIIDTYVYREGIQNLRYGFATAVGLLKSVASLILVILSYKLADKFANYRIF